MSSLKQFLAKLKAADDRHTHLINTRFSVVFRWECQPPKDQLGANTYNYMDQSFIDDFDFYIKRINVPNIKISDYSPIIIESKNGEA
jgi:hypothetical protein